MSCKSDFMKKYLFIPALLLTIVLCGFFQADSWVKYNSAEGHYSISFPGKPEETTQDDKNEDGTPFKIHSSTYAPNDKEVYMSGWIDMTTYYPKNGDVKQMLENSRDGVTSAMNAIKVTTLETKLGDKPYIEFTFFTNQSAGKGRIYLVNKFQYSIITICPIKTGVTAAAEKFIHSFTVI